MLIIPIGGVNFQIRNFIQGNYASNADYEYDVPMPDQLPESQPLIPRPWKGENATHGQHGPEDHSYTIKLGNMTLDDTTR